MLSAAIVASAAACGTSKPSVSVSSTPSVVSSDTISNESLLNEKKIFDYDKVCKNIKLGDRAINIPFSVKDLGMAYSIDYDNAYYTKMMIVHIMLLLIFIIIPLRYLMHKSVIYRKSIKKIIKILTI